MRCLAMKRHLSFVAALSMCFFASIAATYAQQIRAETGSIAIGGSVTGSTVIIGIPQEKVDELVRDAKRPLEELTTQQRENITLLKEKLDLNERQVRAALGIPVRRQTTREECTEAEWSLAARLAEHPWRLVVMGEREVDKRVVAEVAHEALLRAWPRLADWLREERDFLVFKGDTERAQRRWLAMGQVDKALLTGLDLARAEEWLPTRPEDLSREVTAFVQSSAAADRVAKERQLRLQRRMTCGALAATLIMMLIGGFAWFQWAEADRAKLLAQKGIKDLQTTQSLFLAGVARQQRTAGDAGTAILLSLEALPDSDAGITRPYVSESESQLDAAWRDLRERLVLTGHEKAVHSALFSPDGKRVVTASFDKTTWLWDAETGKQIGEPLAGHAELVLSAAFSPDGKRIVTASEDKTARLWEAETGKQIGEPLKGHEDAVTSAAFSSDGKRIVT